MYNNNTTAVLSGFSRGLFDFENKLYNASFCARVFIEDEDGYGIGNLISKGKGKTEESAFFNAFEEFLSGNCEPGKPSSFNGQKFNWRYKKIRLPQDVQTVTFSDNFFIRFQNLTDSALPYTVDEILEKSKSTLGGKEVQIEYRP